MKEKIHCIIQFTKYARVTWLSILFNEIIIAYLIAILDINDTKESHLKIM